MALSVKAVEYYEIDISLWDIQSLFEKGFSEELAIKMNSSVNFADLLKDLKEIGFNS